MCVLQLHFLLQSHWADASWWQINLPTGRRSRSQKLLSASTDLPTWFRLEIQFRRPGRMCRNQAECASPSQTSYCHSGGLPCTAWNWLEPKEPPRRWWGQWPCICSFSGHHMGFCICISPTLGVVDCSCWLCSGGKRPCTLLYTLFGLQLQFTLLCRLQC